MYESKKTYLAHDAAAGVDEMKDSHMKNLTKLITEALADASNDTDLAKKLVDSGALTEIARLGTYEEHTVQDRLDYASSAALRAVLSKVRRNMGSFPLPVLEGRLWSRSSVDNYSQRTRSSKTAPMPTEETISPATPRNQ